MHTRYILLCIILSQHVVWAADQDPLHGLHPTLRRAQPSCSYAPQSEVEPDIAFYKMHYAIDLPSFAVAEKRVTQLIQQDQKFLPFLRILQDPDKLSDLNYPTILHFVGPSGSGKTTAATSLVKYLRKTNKNIFSLFIKGSSIANTYQNSGATFFNDLFAFLLRHPEYTFMVILDELSAVTKIAKKNNDIQQENISIALWTGLDSIRNRRNICIISTDNNDPETLPDPLKTRFRGKIFYFKHPNTAAIVEIVRDQLNTGNPRSSGHACSNKFLHTFVQNASYLTLRELEELVNLARTYACIENVDEPIIKEHHIMKAFEDYKRPSWYEKLWLNRYALISLRAISWYMVATGICLELSDGKTKLAARPMIALGAALNYIASFATENGTHDLPLINFIYHMAQDYQQEIRYIQSRIDRECDKTLDRERYTQQRRDRIEDRSLDSERYNQSRTDREQDKKLDKERYDQQRRDRTDDQSLDRERYDRSREDRVEDKRIQHETHMEGLRHQYLLNYISGLYAIPLVEGRAWACQERDYLARVREGIAAELGINFDSYRVMYGRTLSSNSNKKYT